MLALYLGLARQTEILVIIFLGICFLSTDFSLFHVTSNLGKIWGIQLNRLKYLELPIKYLIAAIMLTRTFTLHAFLAFYIIMLWPAIFNEKPSLMLPWLLLGILRCLILNSLTFLLGTYICQKEAGLSPLCLEYIFTQIIEHGPSVYAWTAVLSYYRDMVAEGQDSQLSSELSLLSQSKKSQCKDGAETVEEEASNKTRSYSLSDLNLDYLYSSRMRNLPADATIEAALNELKLVFAQRRIIRGSSKSFDSLIRANCSQHRTTPSLSNTSIITRVKGILKISDEDIIVAKQRPETFSDVVKQLSLSDITKPSLSTKSFYMSKGLLYRGPKSHLPISQSQVEEAKTHETCLCILKTQLHWERSNQTLFEIEIANVTLNETEDELPKTENLNGNRDGGVGGRFRFNPNAFLRKFVLKKNTSKNFGCQVSLLRRGFLENRAQLAKKLMFFRALNLP